MDCAAFGMPAPASEPLIYDMDTPEFVKPLPVVVSPLILAEALTEWLSQRPSVDLVEEQRRQYVTAYSADRYALELLEAMGVDHD